jgi:hypothetical protein
MRISETITIRGGQAFAIISYSEDGPSLLRRIAMPERVTAPEPIYRAVVATPAPVVSPAPTPEPATITYARRLTVSVGTRYGSCAKRGLRKDAQVRHYYDCRLYDYDHGDKCWKSTRKTRYKSH